jgi:peptidyl-prolyl cis-trans isomerase SurA
VVHRIALERPRRVSRPAPSSHGRRLLLALAAAGGLGWACRSTPADAPATVSPDTWAVVDGRAITRDEVEKAFRRVGDGAETLSDEEALTMKLGILDELIVEDILVAKAAALKIVVPDGEVDGAYAEARKNIAADAFEQELSRRRLTASDVRSQLRRDLIARKVLEQEVGSKVTVTDREVTDFFNANRAQFNLPEDAYHLAQIVVTPVREPQLANRTGDDATTPQAASAKVAMLMERLKGGAQFADVARDYSEDPESAPRGGDLGLVPLSAVRQAAPALRDAVLAMTPGNARVVSQGGAHTIVFVVAREPAGQRDLSTPKVRDQITQTLRARREQMLRTAYLTTVRGDAKVVNYLARRVVESGVQAPSLGLTRPGAP